MHELFQRLDAFSLQGLQNLRRATIDQVEFQALAWSLEKQFGRRGRKSERAREIVRAALVSGTITAFAADPLRDKAFAIQTYAWGSLAAHHHSRRSIDEGIFVIEVGAYPNGSLDRRLANAPLFLSDQEVNRWLKSPPPSRAALQEASQASIAEHQRLCPGRPMRRSDFLDAMKKLFPSASQRQLGGVWGETAPAAWKRPGTKSDRRS